MTVARLEGNQVLRAPLRGIARRSLQALRDL
jgi:hypothetical protein